MFGKKLQVIYPFLDINNSHSNGEGSERFGDEVW